MILDNGEQVFLWLGSRCSEVEVKLAYKSAQVSLHCVMRVVCMVVTIDGNGHYLFAQTCLFKAGVNKCEPNMLNKMLHITFWQVYIQHMRAKQPDRLRKLFLTLKNKESRRFTKCFHGWSQHKRPPEWHLCWNWGLARPPLSTLETCDGAFS